jgi:hypothetical protein
MSIENAPNAAMSFAFVEGCDVPSPNEFVQAWILASYKINTLLTVTKASKKKK